MERGGMTLFVTAMSLTVIFIPHELLFVWKESLIPAFFIQIYVYRWQPLLCHYLCCCCFCVRVKPFHPDLITGDQISGSMCYYVDFRSRLKDTHNLFRPNIQMKPLLVS